MKTQVAAVGQREPKRTGRSHWRSGAAATALVLLIAGPARAADWKPVDPAQLALRTPRVDENADAEALFWNVRVEDDETGGYPRGVLRHYVRVKIFTDRGKEKFAQVDLHFNDDDVTFGEVAARTITPAGAILEVKSADIHSRVVVAQGGRKASVVSFALPGVEPGAIVEYRWRETRNARLTHYVPLPLQLDIPVWVVTYSIRPLALDYPMRAQPFNAQLYHWTREADGAFTTSIEDVEAFKSEPDMPPEDQVRGWMLVYYAEPRQVPPATFWKDFGQDLYRAYRDRLKPSDEMAAAAREIVGEGGASMPQTLSRLFEFCRTRIRNADADDSGLTEEERHRTRREGRTLRDVLRERMGTSRELDLLFGALAASSGADVRVAAAADRGKVFFDPELEQPYLLDDVLIAIRTGEAWDFFRPSSRFVPAGSLRWQNEGVKVLVSDPKEPVFVETPLRPAQASVAKRRGRLRLSGDGTLEGDVQFDYSGHRATDVRERYATLSAAAREEALVAGIHSSLPAAEVSRIEVENLDDLGTAVRVACHVRVPGYAQRTGKRLILRPSLFQQGTKARFTAHQRLHDVYFHYPWSEDDDVAIELPPGFELDGADAPPGVDSGETGRCTVKIFFNARTNTLTLRRAFAFGGAGQILFERSLYPSVKQFFDLEAAQDAHAIALKEKEGR